MISHMLLLTLSLWACGGKEADTSSDTTDTSEETNGNYGHS